MSTRLSPDQQESVETFQSVTGVSDVQERISYLESADWDLTRALELFFAASDGGRARAGSLGGGATAAAAGPSDVANRGPEGGILDILGRVFGAGAPQAPLRASTRNHGAAFVEKFERKYGERHPKFHDNTFNDAMNQAKRQFKFLIVYIHSSRHVDTDEFCSRVLTNDELATYIDENFITWAGDVLVAEAVEISNALRLTTYPSVAVLSHQGQTLEVIEGLTGVDEVKEKLKQVVEEHGAVLVAARIDQEERNLERQLREEQDREFEESLARDRARDEEKKKKEEEERRKVEEAAELEREAERAKEEKKVAKQRKREALPPEPAASSDCATIMFRLPDGSKTTRRFDANSKFQHVFDYVETLDFEEEHYELMQNFPNRTFNNPDEGLREAGMVPQGMLIVHEL